MCVLHYSEMTALAWAGFHRFGEDQNLPLPCYCSVLRCFIQKLCTLYICAQKQWEAVTTPARYWPQGNTEHALLLYLQVMPVQSAGDQSLCLHLKDGSHSLRKAAVAPHRDMQHFKPNNTNKCLVLHRQQLGVSQRWLAAEANWDGIGNWQKRSVRGMFSYEARQITWAILKKRHLLKCIVVTPASETKCRWQSDLILQWEEKLKQHTRSFTTNRNIGDQFLAVKFSNYAKPHSFHLFTFSSRCTQRTRHPTGRQIYTTKRS